MSCERPEIAWRVGGPQGSGVDTAARLYAWACALGGLHVFGRREYYSNIKGRHSYYDVRAAPYRLTSHRDDLELLVSFEPETLARHCLSVVEGGAIVYNTDDADVPLDRITFLDPRVRDDLAAYLDERWMPPTTAGIIDSVEQRGLNTYPVPFDELSSRLAETAGVPKSLADRTLNAMAVAVSCAMLQHDKRHLIAALERAFGGKPKLADLNVAAVELASEYVAGELDTDGFRFCMPTGELPGEYLVVSGSEAVALGKLASGLGFQSYYPISPATDESVYIEGHANFPDRDKEKGSHSVVVVQTEDELSAVGMASAAALTGTRSATATSGPGLSLMIEGLGWAGTNEVPLVLTQWQRCGPSTGMPTRTEQGDLLFAIRAGHGEFPRIVLASSDLTEAFYDAGRAFNYAERYQMPVIHLLDKALSSTTQTVPRFDIEEISIDRGSIAERPGGSDGKGPYARFAPTESGVTPRALLGQPGGIHWTTGAEHTVLGRVTEDPVIREQQMEKRMSKLELAAREIPVADKFIVYGPKEADLTILSWGSTKGAIRRAMERLEADAISARLVHVRLMWPFPAAAVCGLLEDSHPLVAVELNYSGQLTLLVKEQTQCKPDYLIVKYNGRPMSSAELYRALRTIHEGKAETRIVLRNPLE